jgi:hypothetical protein
MECELFGLTSDLVDDILATTDIKFMKSNDSMIKSCFQTIAENSKTNVFNKIDFKAWFQSTKIEEKWNLKADVLWKYILTNDFDGDDIITFEEFKIAIEELKESNSWIIAILTNSVLIFFCCAILGSLVGIVNVFTNVGRIGMAISEVNIYLGELAFCYFFLNRERIEFQIDTVIYNTLTVVEKPVLMPKNENCSGKDTDSCSRKNTEICSGENTESWFSAEMIE